MCFSISRAHSDFGLVFIVNMASEKLSFQDFVGEYEGWRSMQDNAIFANTRMDLLSYWKKHKVDRMEVIDQVATPMVMM